MAGKETEQLHQLARLYDIQTAYSDVSGERKVATPEALLSVLQALGAPVLGTGDLLDAVRARLQQLWQRCLEPVTVAWEGEPIRIELRMPKAQARGVLHCELHPEAGPSQYWVAELERLATLQGVEVEGVEYLAKELMVPGYLPRGYHRLRVSAGPCSGESLVITAPRRAFTGGAGPGEGRSWGIFLPLYALRSNQDWGAGNYTDLSELRHWVAGLGGGLVGTLPLLPTFLDEPFDPSPYSPVSRLFWNEFFLDLSRSPELAHCDQAREIIASPAFRAAVAALREATLVQYREGMVLRRQVLEELARCCLSGTTGRREELLTWARAHPHAWDYARFRAVGERLRVGWPAWPERLQDGQLEPQDYDPRVAEYHLYAQFLAQEQVEGPLRRGGASGTGLYLDFPLGVNGAGYDVWRERAAFAPAISTGAPPDPLQMGGQNWGFPPLHPEGIREQGYRYFIAALRHHLRPAAALRIDHVMGLHRLFWIPRGMEARDGVYVRYRSEEFWAILTLESQRHQTVLVGEDLGIVPESVRTAMAEHRVRRMYVLPFETQTDPDQPVRAAPAEALACLNTHDMPPFAAWWRQVREQEPGLAQVLPAYLHRAGWLPEAATDPAAVLRGSLSHLAAGPADLLLINLEDLWLENEPQNVPGTGFELPNWRRKARFGLPELRQNPVIQEFLTGLDRLRRQPARTGQIGLPGDQPSRS